MSDFGPGAFNPATYGPDVARILELDGNGYRLPSLTCGVCTSEEARQAMKASSPQQLFPGVKDPAAAAAGLWLYLSCFEEAHELASQSETPDCNLWHAVLHRREPDGGNAAYWFRRVGTHPIYPQLSRSGSEILKRIPDAEFRVGKWDAFAFIAFCDRARAQPCSAQEMAAMEIQRAEWQILFDYCARPK